MFEAAAAVAATVLAVIYATALVLDVHKAYTGDTDRFYDDPVLDMDAFDAWREGLEARS